MRRHRPFWPPIAAEVAAAHVVEPPLCGCGAVYLNLGCFYDSDGLSARADALRSAQKKNQSYYPAVYAHLRAAASLEQSARESMERADPEGLFRLLRGFYADLAPSKTGRGQCREVFLSAYTPAGYVEFPVRCGCTVALADPCGLSAPLLERLLRHYRHAGYDCVGALSPLSADRLTGLIVPELDTAFLAAPEPADCAVEVNLRRCFKCCSADALLAQARAHTTEAVRLLAEAKAAHDELEALYRPFVSFEGLDLLTREYQKNLRAELPRA